MAHRGIPELADQVRTLAKIESESFFESSQMEPLRTLKERLASERKNLRVALSSTVALTVSTTYLEAGVSLTELLYQLLSSYEVSSDPS